MATVEEYDQEALMMRMAKPRMEVPEDVRGTAHRIARTQPPRREATTEFECGRECGTLCTPHPRCTSELRRLGCR